MKIVPILLLVMNICEDVMQAIDVDQLNETLEDIKESSGCTTDAALRVYAERLDAAFDWTEALEDYGIVGDAVGRVMEDIDESIWYYALRIHYRVKSKDFKRKIRKLQAQMS